MSDPAYVQADEPTTRKTQLYPQFGEAFGAWLVGRVGRYLDMEAPFSES